MKRVSRCQDVKRMNHENFDVKISRCQDVRYHHPYQFYNSAREYVKTLMEHDECTNKVNDVVTNVKKSLDLD